MDILTHSSMSLFKQCRRKFHFRNNLHLVPLTSKASLNLGKAVHKGLELYYLGCGIEEMLIGAIKELDSGDRTGWAQPEYDALAVQMATLEGMLRGYMTFFNDREAYQEIIPEKEFVLPIINPETNAASKSFMHAGKIDGLFKKDGQWWLREFKTASQVGKDYLDRLKLDTQITSYIDAIQEAMDIQIVGVIYTIIKKPSIKQKQTETVQDYCNRLISDYQDPTPDKEGKPRINFYFYQEEIFRNQDDLLEWRFERWEVAKDILESKRTQRYYRNTALCSQFGGCEYLPLCSQGQSVIHLYQQKDPNEELSDWLKRIR